MTSPEYGKAPELLIGTPAREVVKEILRINSGVSDLTLRLHPFLENPPVEPYGEVPMQEIEISQYEILIHSGLEKWINYLGVLDEDEIDWDLLEREEREISEDGPFARYLSIDSRVEVPGLAHIPMLDFDCPKTFSNLEIILDTLRTQGQKGYILDSGNSFHFWGIAPLFGPSLFSEYNWREFLEMNRESSLVDRKFINLSLKRRFSSLRITESMDENRKPVPKVIATL